MRPSDGIMRAADEVTAGRIYLAALAGSTWG
jgi:hypothetical protein